MENTLKDTEKERKMKKEL